MYVPYPRRNLSTFHEASIQVRKLKKAGNMSRKSAYHERHMKLPITNRTGKLKV